MRRELEDPIKDEVLQGAEECVCPVPRQVRDDAVRIGLDPEVEDEEGYTGDPSQGVPCDGAIILESWRAHERDAAEEVREKVVEQNDVDHVSEDDPGVPLDG